MDDLVVYQDGPAGRRAALVGGPEVVDVVGMVVGGDVPEPKRRERAARLLDISLAAVDAAMAYYAEHSNEIDAELRWRYRTPAGPRSLAGKVAAEFSELRKDSEAWAAYLAEFEATEINDGLDR